MHDIRSTRFGFLLVRAQKRVERWVGAAEAGSSAPRGALLLAVADDGVGSAFGAVAQALHIRASTLSGLVDRMAEAGLIERIGDAADGRALRLRLTAQGRITRAAAAQRVHAMNERLCAGFTDAELAVVARWLEAVPDKFRGDEE